MKTIRRFLALIATTLCLSGAAQAFEVRNILREGQSITYRVFFSGGVPHVVAAHGDSDAFDIDVEIMDLNGNVIAADLDDDAEPFVVFRPWRSGYYLVRVTMVDTYHGVPAVFEVSGE